MFSRWIAATVLLVIAFTGGWVLYTLNLDTFLAPNKSPHRLEAYIENFVTIEMDEAGKPKRRLEADHMALYFDETSELSNPYYTIYRTDGEPWHVRSERGQVSANGDVVFLSGKVDIWRNDRSGNRELDIETQDLKVLPDSEYGETEKPATIRTPTSESKGIGMRAYLDEDRIELLSQVRTYVDKNRPTQ